VDGVTLVHLLELLTHKSLRGASFHQNPHIRMHKIENLELFFDSLAHEHLKIVDIGPEDIIDGRLTSELIWRLILRFQIVKGEVKEDYGDEASKSSSAKQLLLEWCVNVLQPFDLVPSDFQQAWTNGMCFCGLIDAIKPDTISFDFLSKVDHEKNLELAFTKAKELFGIPKLLDPEDMTNGQPNEMSVMTYVSYFRQEYSARHGMPLSPPSQSPIESEPERTPIKQERETETKKYEREIRRLEEVVEEMKSRLGRLENADTEREKERSEREKMERELALSRKEKKNLEWEKEDLKKEYENIIDKLRTETASGKRDNDALQEEVRKAKQKLQDKTKDIKALKQV